MIRRTRLVKVARAGAIVTRVKQLEEHTTEMAREHNHHEAPRGNMNHVRNNLDVYGSVLDVCRALPVLTALSRLNIKVSWCKARGKRQTRGRVRRFNYDPGD